MLPPALLSHNPKVEGLAQRHEPKVGEGLAPSRAGGAEEPEETTEPFRRPPPPQPSPARAAAPRPERERAPPPENVGCAPRTMQLLFLGLGGGAPLPFGEGAWGTHGGGDGGGGGGRRKGSVVSFGASARPPGRGQAPPLL